MGTSSILISGLNCQTYRTCNTGVVLICMPFIVDTFKICQRYTVLFYIALKQKINYILVFRKLNIHQSMHIVQSVNFIVTETPTKVLI